MDKLHRRTSIRPNLWSRAALGYSLSLESDIQETRYDSEGQEFNENVFFGEDEDILLAFLRQRLIRVPEPNELGHIVKLHVERGLKHFAEEFERHNFRGDELILSIFESCSVDNQLSSKYSFDLLPEQPKGDSYAVNFTLGQRLNSNEAANHILNSPGTAPHLAIMGRNGTGKTRTGLSYLLEINKTCPYPIPFLIFDYAKGDIASNDSFKESTNTNVIRMPENRIPLTPLTVNRDNDFSIQLAARRFRDTICSVVKLGPIQKDRCLQLIVTLYNNFNNQTPDLADLTDLAEHEYQVNDWNEDSLLVCLREFSRFPLFQSAFDGEEHILFKKSHIIDIHNLPEDLRKLSTFLVLDRLYSEIMSLSDAPLDKNNNRQIRYIIIIDEAHHYLPCRQPTLANMIREVRSKGVSLWLFSQSPDDFDQKQYNFAREMGLLIVFSCMVERPRMLESLLGGKIDHKRLTQLGPGVAMTRTVSFDFPIEIQVWES